VVVSAKSARNMDWSSLCNAPPPASLGVASGQERITVCEQNALIMTSSQPEARNLVTRTLSGLPVVTVTSSCSSEAGGSNAATTTAHSLKRKSSGNAKGAQGSSAGCGSAPKSAKWAFLPPKQEADGGTPALAKLFWTLLREEGLNHAVNELVNKTAGGATAAESTNSYHRLQSKAILLTAETFLSVYNFMTLNIYGTLRPAINMSAEELTEKFHPTRDWSGSHVRCLAWHPHTNKLAVALRDDSVHVHNQPPTATERLYHYQDKSPAPFVPLLKYKQQRGVTSMAWRPFYASELAVGCSTGVLVWTIDPSSVVARPSAGCVSLLQSPGHSPVSHVEWQPNGELLLSVSAVDSSVILWNTASETGEVLRRVGILGGGIGGFHCAQFSPDGKSLFAAHATTEAFRMWSTSKWTQESWRISGGSVKSACWSSDSSTLLYAVTNDCKIFCIKFRPVEVQAPGTAAGVFDGEDSGKVAGAAVPVMDLQQVTFSNEDGAEVTTGGEVQSMRWDPTGERLAVSFVGSNLIAIFQTLVTPTNMSVNPVGFVVGADDDESPSCFEFAPHFPQTQEGGGGALLTVSWSSGRVQHFPMFFTSSKNTGEPYGNNNFHLEASFDVDPRATVYPTLSRQLSTSHLQNQSIRDATDFEPRLFSGPAI